MRLRDKVAVVTGGGGMGRAIAIEFARQGATVMVADIDIEAARDTAKEAGDCATPSEST